MGRPKGSVNKSRVSYIGKKYNELLVLAELESRGGHRMFLCECSCGKIVTAYLTNITTNKSKSCGCVRGTHGLSSDRFYHIWDNMRRRCENPNATAFHRYGGRGVTLCSEWRIFENFRDDMYEDYLVVHKDVSNCQIDRIDNNGNYCKENCRWVSPLENSKNKDKPKNSRTISINGKRIYVSDLAKKTGINSRNLRSRIDKGWSAKDVLLKVGGKR